MNSKCPNCGEAAAHFVPPLMGEKGFFICNCMQEERNMIHSFPKIFHLGTKNVANIFDSDVEITEKIDGSQFNFGLIDGTLHMRSKGADIVNDCPEKMFKLAVDHVLNIQHSLHDGYIYHCEYLNKPKHNVITYDRVPKNNIICFGISNPAGVFLPDFISQVRELEIEAVPVLYTGRVLSMEWIEKLLETESILGGHKVEGVVIKNYSQQLLIGDRHIPILSAKYVSEEYKEKHSVHKSEFSGKSRLECLIQSYRTEARWHKAVQHLTEQGQLEQSPTDIGSLMKEVHRDIEEECKEDIKDLLWREYSKKIKRVSTAGMAIWYKKLIAIEHFTEKDRVEALKAIKGIYPSGTARGM